MREKERNMRGKGMGGGEWERGGMLYLSLPIRLRTGRVSAETVHVEVDGSEVRVYISEPARLCRASS